MCTTEGLSALMISGISLVPNADDRAGVGIAVRPAPSSVRVGVGEGVRVAVSVGAGEGVSVAVRVGVGVESVPPHAAMTRASPSVPMIAGNIFVLAIRKVMVGASAGQTGLRGLPRNRPQLIPGDAANTWPMV